MFTPNCRHCPLFQKFTGGVLNLPKSCMLCPLGQTQLEFLVCPSHEDTLVISYFQGLFCKILLFMDHFVSNFII
ncbi:hypothetical protein Hanom_Chr12g01081141 [Helianthus anomalus]